MGWVWDRFGDFGFGLRCFGSGLRGCGSEVCLPKSRRITNTYGTGPGIFFVFSLLSIFSWLFGMGGGGMSRDLPRTPGIVFALVNA